MKTKNLDQRSIAVLNYKNIYSVDEKHRKHAGLASYVFNYRDGIIYLQVDNMERVIATSEKSAHAIAYKWKKDVAELNGAIGYVAVFKKRDTRPGFMYNLDTTKTEFNEATEAILTAFRKLNKDKTEPSAIYCGFFDDHSSKVLVDLV